LRVALPGCVVELKPGPGTLILSGLKLLGPHIVERCLRIGSELTRPRVVTRQDQRIENGLSSARFRSFRNAARLVGLEWRNFLPHPNAFDDVVQKLTLDWRGSLLAEGLTKRRSRDAIRCHGVTGDTESFVIASRRRPAHPPG